MTDDLKMALSNLELRINSLEQWHIALKIALVHKRPMATEQALSFITTLLSELRHVYNIIYEKIKYTETTNDRPEPNDNATES